MTHQEAVEIKAPERYVLGDLSETELDAFEEHFAGCSRCLDDVCTVTEFAANARAVFRERAAQPPERERRWFGWLRPEVLIPSFAALAFAAVAGYQNFVVMPSLRSPRSVAESIILDGATRSAVPHAAAGGPLRFQMGLESAPSGGQVRVELTDASGTVLSQGPIKTSAPGQPLDVYFPIKLKPGRYWIVIRNEQSGRGGQELARSPFEIAVQEDHQ